jgi:hypothetical protein
MAAYGLGRAPYPGVGGYSGECVLFVRLGGTRSLFTRLRLKTREEKRQGVKSGCNAAGVQKQFLGLEVVAWKETYTQTNTPNKH